MGMPEGEQYTRILKRKIKLEREADGIWRLMQKPEAGGDGGSHCVDNCRCEKQGIKFPVKSRRQSVTVKNLGCACLMNIRDAVLVCGRKRLRLPLMAHWVLQVRLEKLYSRET